MIFDLNWVIPAKNDFSLFQDDADRPRIGRRFFNIAQLFD